MANDLNKAMIIGRLGKDPETKYTQNGDAVCSFSVATGSSWKDKNSGEKKESTEWHNVTAFGKLAEICGEYLEKGKQVYIEGRLKTEKYKDRDGVDRWSTKIYADTMQMLASPAGGSRDSGDREASGGRGYSAPAPTPEAAKKEGPQKGFDDMDDDIPF